jgi:hypothetical protein
MSKRTLIQRVILVLMIVIAIAGTIFHAALSRQEKPWMAFYVACCSGVLIVNLILVLIFVRRNIK